ncbi:MAG: TolC family protein [Verrucomicrobiota bacterium]
MKTYIQPMHLIFWLLMTASAMTQDAEVNEVETVLESSDFVVESSSAPEEVSQNLLEEGLDPALKYIFESTEGLDPALFDEVGLGPNVQTVIAVVRDGPMPLSEMLAPLLTEELDELLGEGRYELRESERFDANWDYDAAGKILERTLSNPEVDMVLAVGLNVISAAGNPELELRKPVIGANILRSTVWGLKYTEDGRSEKKNLVFNMLPNGATQDLQSFHDLVGFSKAYVLVDQSEVGSKEVLRKAVRDTESKVDFRIGAILASPTIEGTVETIRRLAPEAIYLTPLTRYSLEEQEQLFQEINQMGIPTFSMLGQVMVERGVLAGQSMLDPKTLARRVALNIYSIQRGSAPEELGVIFSTDSNLVINSRTAQQIGFYPDFSIAMTADFLYRDDLFQGQILEFEQAIQQAKNNNVGVLIEMATTRRTEAEKNIVRSDLLPQLRGRTSYTAIEQDRALNGLTPQLEHTAGATLQQVLFSDAIISNYRASINSLLSQKAIEEAVRLDAANDGAQDYINLLLARALLKVEVANLRLTQSNLQLARVRQMAGSSGPEEVLRWESEVANSRTNVLSAEELTKAALVVLNQTLNQDQQTEWLPQDIILAEGDMYFLDNEIQEIIHNTSQLNEFRDFSVRKALELSPTLRSIDESISGQQITLGERRRSFYLPEISMEFSYERSLDADFRGGQRTMGLDEDEWTALLVAELPIFEGWRRPSQVNRERSELERLVETQIQTTQLIELNTRTALFAIENSYPSIRLTRLALDRSRRNLDLVRDKYIEGKVGVTDLIDAQETALNAERSAVQASYVFLGDLYNYQRSISWFEVDHSPEERDAFKNQMRQFIEAKRIEKGRRGNK